MRDKGTRLLPRAFYFSLMAYTQKSWLLLENLIFHYLLNQAVLYYTKESEERDLE